ncbi:MAG: DUF2867 domain-containing protein [Prolixibacteraceae bacterium]|nr:DUF2867 domain-containing protein [Prolixibacteraceae bacterium]
MKKVKRTNKVPENSIIAKDFVKTDYCDSFQIVTQNDDTIDKITTDIFQTPKWADILMGIRNSVVKIVGLKGGGRKMDTHSSDFYPIGSKAVYFTVIDRNENEIVMAENDKHLNFKVSVLLDRHGNNVAINLTTIVKFNNFLGHLYFLPVKPFHRIIIISLLKRILKKEK